MNDNRRSVRGLCAWASKVFFSSAVLALLTFTMTPGRAQADSYDPQKAGNPLRIAAYILHPVGVLLDYGLMRPCFWVVKREPFATIFGYERQAHRDHSEEEPTH